VTALPNGELPWRGTAGQADRGATCRPILEIRPTPSSEKGGVECVLGVAPYFDLFQ
jgi:hypothetical protein